MTDRTRKGWSADTLERLGVKFEAGRFVFRLQTDDGLDCGAVRYRDHDGPGRKMYADDDTTRELWPRPEVVSGSTLYVVEGEPDAVSMAEIGLPAIAFPGTGKWSPDWPRRLVFDPGGGRRERVVFIADCDDGGRNTARQHAAEVSALGVPGFFLDLAPDRDDKYDVGDLLREALDYDPEGGTAVARRLVEDRVADAEEITPAEPDPEEADRKAKLRAKLLAVLPPQPGPWPEPLHDAAYHGLAGQFVGTVGPHSEADPAGLLLEFLSVFGCMAGTQAGWKVDGAFHPGRLWPLLVGDTSRGRKGTAAARVREVMDLAVPAFWREHQRAGLASGQGVVWHVRDPLRTKRKPKKGETVDSDGFVVEDEGVTDKRLLVHEGEFAHILAVMRKEGNTLSTTLREFWDHGTYGSLTKHDPVTATGAHVIVIGHVTARELRERLTGTDQANGFGNRFLVVCVRRSQRLPFGGNLDDESLSWLAGRVREALAEAAKVRGRLTMDDAARELWASVYDALTDGGDDMLSTMTARAEAQVIRLAVVYALTDAVAIIEEAHLRAALAVWRYCEQSAVHVFGGKSGNELADRLLAMTRAAGEDGTTRGELRDGVSHDIDTPRFDLALGHLERCLYARREREATPGRPRERWFAEPGYKPPERDERSDAETFIPKTTLSSRYPEGAYNGQGELLAPDAAKPETHAPHDEDDAREWSR